MFSVYSCTSVQPVYILTGGLRVTDVTKPFLPFLYAWISSRHSSPTSSTGHNMPHRDALIKSQSCHHNLTFSFLFPPLIVPCQKEANPSNHSHLLLFSNKNDNENRNNQKIKRLLKSSAFLLSFIIV